MRNFSPKDDLFGKFQVPGVVLIHAFSTITSELAYHATIIVAFTAIRSKREMMISLQRLANGQP